MFQNALLNTSAPSCSPAGSRPEDARSWRLFRNSTWRAAPLVAAIALGLSGAQAQAQRLPEIRTTAQNRVPPCVTPERLMQFLKERNPGLDQKFNGIAGFYKQHGETTRVRWDYAFYQMILETNALKFGNDVSPRQNNFAGLGATGGGVMGDSFRSVSDGVLGHLQHLVAYSGEEVQRPVSRRTAEVQKDVIWKSRRVGRPITFSDLTMRWAMDRGYGRKIDGIAEAYREMICSRQQQAPPPAAESMPQPPPSVRQPTRRAAAAPPVVIEEKAPPVVIEEKAAPVTGSVPAKAAPQRPIEPKIQNAPAEKAEPKAAPAVAVPQAPTPPAAAPPAPPVPATQVPATKAPPVAGNAACSVLTASFGGTVTLLIKSTGPDNKIMYTALGVVEGQEQAMAQAYMAKHAPGGSIVGQFTTRDAAVAQAYQKCDSGKH